MIFAVGHFPLLQWLILVSMSAGESMGGIS